MLPEDSLRSLTMFSIMHISDLHRSPSDPVSNAMLIESLLADRDAYPLNGIPTPDAVVVSGDLIYGAPLGAPDYRENVQQQYEVAIEFLVDLTERFLDGDRSRVVIAPGNHDCCWNTAKSAMRRIARDQEPGNIRSLLHDEQANLRWSWEDRSYYKIDDFETYRSRFNAYWNCVERFYGPVDLQIPLCRSRGFNVFELDCGRINIVAFESQQQNDHLSNHGYIRRETISESALRLRDGDFQAPLKIAVWHHGIAGPPMASDYLDVSSVLEMAGVGYRLGFHGHQHYADISTQYIHLPETEAMAIVGAGSLCAGERDLPHRVNRQYNIVVIDDSYRGARVHVREIIEANRFGASGDPRFAPDGSFMVQWEPMKDIAGRTIDHGAAQERAAILGAECALKQGEASTAMKLLSSSDLSNDLYARELFAEAAQTSGAFSHIINVLDPPKNAAELVRLVEAQRRVKDFDAGLRALEQYQVALALAPSVAEDLQCAIQFDLALGGTSNEHP